MSTICLLLSAFVLSMGVILVFFWIQRDRLFECGARWGEAIFVLDEIGPAEDPASGVSLPAMSESLAWRIAVDASIVPLVLLFCAIALILVASSALRPLLNGEQYRYSDFAGCWSHWYL